MLVVEDNQLLADLTQYTLADTGYRCEAMSDPDAALKRVPEFRPDIVLLDLDLGAELTGFDVARQIREMAAIAQPLLVAYTGYQDERVEQEVRHAGFDGLLGKPLMVEALQELWTAREQRKT